MQQITVKQLVFPSKKLAWEHYTQQDLEDAEEVGREGRDSVAIVNFCRKAMGIYDFELSAEQLEELGCSPKEVRLVLTYLRMEQSQTQHSLEALVVAIGSTSSIERSGRTAKEVGSATLGSLEKRRRNRN
jgi:hypothetical protein